MNVPELQELTRTNMIESCIRVRYPDFYKYIISNFPPDLKWSEKLYWYYHDVSEHPKCIVCGADAPFHTLFSGYKKYCCRKCANASPSKIEKTKQTQIDRYGGVGFNSQLLRSKAANTNIKRYGTENPFQSEEVKDKIKKTNIERYGVENPSMNPVVRGKIKQSLVERYGVENPMKSADIQNRAKQTCLEKYGVEYPSQSQEIHDKIVESFRDRYGVDWITQSDEFKDASKQTCLEKYGTEYYNNREQAEQTCLEKYGTEHYNNREQAEQTCLEKYGTKHATQNKEILEKTRQTCLEKYGTEHVMQSESVKIKSKQTCLEKYGTEHVMQSDVIKERAAQTNLERYGVENPGYLNSDDIIIPVVKNDKNEYRYKCPHPECNKCSDRYYWCAKTIHNDRKQFDIELCTILRPTNANYNKGTTIEIFVRNILDAHNIEYECNNRSVLGGKEIDIYVPSKKIGIECNGIYWHSTSSPQNPPASKHFRKWKECKENGIQLLTIWEDQIINKPEIVESIILSKLGIYERRLYARNCEVREVDSKECCSFLKTYHLQGASNSKVRYGLYYNDELVSVMTFGLKRKCMGGKGEWELHRYCNKKGVQVVGGASRLFNHFIKAHKPVFIESFSSNDISDGRLYETLKFDMLKCEYGSYWYIDRNMNRYHRYNFRKDQLVREGFDALKSESRITAEYGFYKIYDTGQTKWIYKKENQ